MFTGYFFELHLSEKETVNYFIIINSNCIIKAIESILRNCDRQIIHCLGTEVSGTEMSGTAIPGTELSSHPKIYNLQTAIS